MFQKSLSVWNVSLLYIFCVNMNVFRLVLVCLVHVFVVLSFCRYMFQLTLDVY